MTDDSAKSPVPPDSAPVADVVPPQPVVGTVPAVRVRSSWTSLTNPFGLGILVTLGGLAAIAFGLALASLSTILIYIALALFVALGLDPAVRMLEKRKLSRGLSIGIVFAAFALVIGLVIWLVMPTVIAQFVQFIESIPASIEEFKKSDAYDWLQTTFGVQAGAVLTAIEDFIKNPANIAAVGGGLLKAGLAVGTAISGFIIVIVLRLYFLASLDQM